MEIPMGRLARGGVSLSWRVYVKEMASHISIFIKTTYNLNVSCGKISQMLRYFKKKARKTEKKSEWVDETSLLLMHLKLLSGYI